MEINRPAYPKLRLTKALVRTARPLSSAVTGTLTAGAASARGGVTVESVAAGLAMTALAMFGFAVNDIFDVHKDQAAENRRPVADGTLSKPAAGCFAGALLAVAMALACVPLSGTAAMGATAALLLLYSPVQHRWPAWKGVYVAALCCAPLFYGGIAGGRPYPWPAYALLAGFVLGREILMDADELASDSAAGMRTVAAILGGGLSARIGAAMMLAASLLLALVAQGAIGRTASVATLISLGGVLTWPGIALHKRIELSRVRMLAGAVALACGAG